ncbi:hypothetical protein GZH47_13445 [Paenibacillus rhizovicinus]|uniref:DUF3221 domain-containing protein n=1 Tax=Paenibacillus rhizovicinus TaxID=2704463 RepID=A0A6C0P1H6_9BACL|nr:hypothetical protein [Paenibacillus rhizovicinus]QHW31743.1 hypothetical protein GZH47_13445 [Paenibacillus rhizovicinus]
MKRKTAIICATTVMLLVIASILFTKQAHEARDVRGDYIIGKDNSGETPKILVARNIKASERSSAAPTLAMSKSRKIDFMYYRLSDLSLYNDLQIGDRVTVKPPSGAYVIDQSWPPQMNAGEVIHY